MEKIITAKEVRKILRSVWPDLRHIWIFDRKLVLLDVVVANEVLIEVGKLKQTFRDELFDCDDFALVYNAFVKLKVASMDVSHNWAFGEAAMVHPTEGIHNQNIFINSKLEVVLFEPQVGEAIEPDQGESVFYVRM